MQGPSPLIVTSVKLIVEEICLKIRQPSVFSFFFFCYHCSKMDFIIIVLRCKENSVLEWFWWERSLSYLAQRTINGCIFNVLTQVLTMSLFCVIYVCVHSTPFT